MKELGRRGVAAAGVALAISPARAQATWPDRTIKAVVGFTAGGCPSFVWGCKTIFAISRITWFDSTSRSTVCATW